MFYSKLNVGLQICESMFSVFIYIFVKKGGLHSGVGVSTVTSQQDKIPSREEFACSPCACVGSLQILHVLPPSKNMHVRLIGDAKLTLRPIECMVVCLCVDM